MTEQPSVDLTQDEAVAWVETQASPRPDTKGILQLLREALDPENDPMVKP